MAYVVYLALKMNKLEYAKAKYDHLPFRVCGWCFCDCGFIVSAGAYLPDRTSIFMCMLMFILIRDVI